MKRAPSIAPGFSLVEITLALGIAAVAVVTAIGLLGVAADASGSAGRDTMFVTTTNAVLNDLRRTRSFDALWEAKPREAGNLRDGFVNKPLAASKDIHDVESSFTHYYFTQEGEMLTGTDPEKDARAIYHCTVKKTPDFPRPKENKGPSNLLKLRLVFTWPVGVDTPNNRQQVNASIARY